MKKPRPAELLAQPEPQAKPLHPRPAPVYAGDILKKCSNCQHFRPSQAQQWRGECRNGISGRLTTDAGEKCEYGFYPSVERFPLRAGPGGIR